MTLTKNYLKKCLVTHLLASLVDKLINAIGEKENKIIIDDIKKNRNKIYEQDEYSNCVIQPTYKRGDLLDAVKIILNFKYYHRR